MGLVDKILRFEGFKRRSCLPTICHLLDKWSFYIFVSFVFRGTREDIFLNVLLWHVPLSKSRTHASRPVNSNSLAFLVTVVLLLFVILNSHQMSPSFLLWLVVGIFLMATNLRMYATCQQLQALARTHAAASSGLLVHTELRFHMPPTIAFATRGRLQ
ncbi:E3 ubiquitin-protein ligase SDIR1-like [Durio zibethinus]|uniref:RING-type E3 ubiquitin transferase n=1 Tax=Durio zibethinus TaxID=66656 RepID=A0A6P5ZP86_DURZI|nr:E3 ubiquitin-protein ligase SDIR1-like [Durio zibethinus]